MTKKERIQLTHALIGADEGGVLTSAEAGMRAVSRLGVTPEQVLEAYIDSLGLRFFKGSELTPYWSRRNKGGTNGIPHPYLWPNIVESLVVLDELRFRLASPIEIISSYRTPGYNRGLPGAAQFSQHLVFNALDFKTENVTPAEATAALKALRGTWLANPDTKTAFTFRGGIGKYQTFVHLDTRGQNADW